MGAPGNMDICRQYFCLNVLVACRHLPLCVFIFIQISCTLRRHAGCHSSSSAAALHLPPTVGPSVLFLNCPLRAFVARRPWPKRQRAHALGQDAKESELLRANSIEDMYSEIYIRLYGDQKEALVG